ncbi:hypothetical protein [Myxococcus sp. NMCA1]|uniref:hypothetical protein n=1 Tax=Myxococcus sp. NMCA1 TaxID=2996785 RepID=UPI003FA53EF5
MLLHWRRLVEERSVSNLGADEAVGPESEVKRSQAQVQELERLLGKKTLGNEILKEALELARPKKTNVAARLAAQGWFPVKAVAAALGVARSNLVP